jgi:hypothetical protein
MPKQVVGNPSQQCCSAPVGGGAGAGAGAGAGVPHAPQQVPALIDPNDALYDAVNNLDPAAVRMALDAGADVAYTESFYVSRSKRRELCTQNIFNFFLESPRGGKVKDAEKKEAKQGCR